MFAKSTERIAPRPLVAQSTFVEGAARPFARFGATAAGRSQWGAFEQKVTSYCAHSRYRPTKGEKLSSHRNGSSTVPPLSEIYRALSRSPLCLRCDGLLWAWPESATATAPIASAAQIRHPDAEAPLPNKDLGRFATRTGHTREAVGGPSRTARPEGLQHFASRVGPGAQAAVTPRGGTHHAP